MTVVCILVFCLVLAVSAEEFLKAYRERTEVLKRECTLPPTGWRCTREPGHDGPCAAVPSNQKEFPFGND